MSIIGRRVSCKGFDHVQGTIVGQLGETLAVVEWDRAMTTCVESISNLVISDEIVMIDHEPPNN